MICPYCRQGDTRVVDSRPNETVIRRRRRCLNRSCQRRFTTYERIEQLSLRVLKKSGSREPFDPQKIRAGLEKACRKRPIDSGQIESMVEVVETAVYQKSQGEVTTHFIGERIMELLREVDEVALMRFASVYREFESVQEFQEELALHRVTLPA